MKARVWMTDKGGSVAGEETGGNYSLLWTLHLLLLNLGFLPLVPSIWGWLGH